MHGLSCDGDRAEFKSFQGFSIEQCFKTTTVQPPRKKQSLGFIQWWNFGRAKVAKLGNYIKLSISFISGVTESYFKGPFSIKPAEDFGFWMTMVV